MPAGTPGVRAFGRAAAALFGVAAAGWHLNVVLLRGVRAVVRPPAQAVVSRTTRRFALELDVAHALARRASHRPRR
jgi:hypothetical protein